MIRFNVALAFTCNVNTVVIANTFEEARHEALELADLIYANYFSHHMVTPVKDSVRIISINPAEEP